MQNRSNAGQRLDITKPKNQSNAGCENAAPQLADDCAKAKVAGLCHPAPHRLRRLAAIRITRDPICFFSPAAARCVYTDNTSPLLQTFEDSSHYHHHGFSSTVVGSVSLGPRASLEDAV